MFKITKLSAMVVLGLVIGAVPVFASTTSYDDYATFLAATSSLTTINFDGDAVGNIGTGDGTGFAVDGVTISALVNLNGGMYGNLAIADFYATTSGSNYLGTDDPYSPYSFYGTDSVTVTLGSPVTAFGLYVLAGADAGAFTLTAQGAGSAQNTSKTFPLPDQSTYYFIGITSDTAFSSVTLAANGNDVNGGPYWNVDDIRYGTANGSTPPPAVPEPASLLLIGTGLVGVVRKVRKA